MFINFDGLQFYAMNVRKKVFDVFKFIIYKIGKANSQGPVEKKRPMRTPLFVLSPSFE